VTASRVRVEFRSAGVVTEDLVEADGLSVLDGVVYLRRADEVLATYTVDDVISMDWSPGPALRAGAGTEAAGPPPSWRRLVSGGGRPTPPGA